MNDNRTTVIIERVFSKRGKTLEEIYIDYLARKIAEFEKNTDNIFITEKENSENRI
jgi:hypothetical protein